MKLLKHENLACLVNIHASFQLYGKSLRYRTATLKIYMLPTFSQISQAW